MHSLGRQMPEVVLEGVRDPAVVEMDVGGALVLVYVVADHLVEQGVELAVVAEDDVSSEIPRKALLVADR